MPKYFQQTPQCSHYAPKYFTCSLKYSQNTQNHLERPFFLLQAKNVVKVAILIQVLPKYSQHTPKYSHFNPKYFQYTLKHSQNTTKYSKTTQNEPKWPKMAILLAQNTIVRYTSNFLK